tara:strand:- start:631 stop:1026 length:396 start_codon:yes stop_codon:yes gene_type:complete
MVKRTDPKTGRKYEANSRKGKAIWEEMKKKKARAAKRNAQKKVKPKFNGYNQKGKSCTANTFQMKKLTPIKSVKNGGIRLSASWYYNTACGGKLSKCEPQPILQPSGQYIVKKIRIVNGKSGLEPRWVKVL